MVYEPPFRITGKSATLMLDIQELLNGIAFGQRVCITPRLRRVNRIKSIHSSLAIEQNTLGFSEVCDILDGKPVLGPEKEIREVRNALELYSLMDELDPFDVHDLLRAHSVVMSGLGLNDGIFRKGGEGVFDEEGRCIHMASPAEFVPGQIADLLKWVKESNYPMLVKSCIYHYEFEFIHPFEDGNGRLGRFWHNMFLTKWNEVFRWIPVESIIRSRQNEYYSVIAQSNESGESTVFLEFMLHAIYEAVLDFRLDIRPIEGIPKDLSVSEGEVLALIGDGSFENTTKAALVLNYSEPTVSRALATLRAKGLIRREGSRKTGCWTVV